MSIIDIFDVTQRAKDEVRGMSTHSSSSILLIL